MKQRFQGQGIGHLLLDTVLVIEEVTAAASVMLLVWETNHAAQRLYKSYDFKKVGERAEFDQQALEFIEAMHTQPIWLNQQWIQLAICTRDADKLIGDIGLCLRDDEMELGYTLHHDYHGRDIARPIRPDALCERMP